MGASGELLLDPHIRDWVLLPIVLIMVMVTMLRTHVQALMASNKKPDANEVRLKNILGRSMRLRGNGRYISPASYAMRKAHFVDSETGVLKQKQAKGAGPANPMQNPMQMMDMMKNNVTFMVQNMFMITWVNSFFSGFVLVKVPFALTMKFKTMLQRGIDLSTLDASYVSSLSWYFIVMFGLRGFMNLFMGNVGPSSEEAQMQMQMGMVGGGQPGFDAKKLFDQEADNLAMAKHDCRLRNAEKDLLKLYAQS